MIRTLCALSIAVLAITPMAVLEGPSPSPATLRAALADPIDPNFVEADVGAAGTLEGPFDAESYANYYELSSRGGQTGQAMVRTLKSNGFAGGYARQWYLPGASEYLGELIMIFARSSGASSIANGSKIKYQQDQGFQSLVEVHLSKGAYGITETSGGYRWTAVIFLKGSNLFVVTQGSADDSMTDQALAQAQRAYAFAPSSITVPAQTNARSGLSQYLRLIAAAGLMLLLAIAAGVATIVVLVRTQRPGSGAAVRSQPKP